MALQLTSPAFADGARIPQKYTGDGEDVSPALQWSDPPAMAKSWALICDDPDAPRGTWLHWVIFNLPAKLRQLDEAQSTAGTFADGTKQGTNDFGTIGYRGPAPPRGKTHRYFFKLYALDTILDLPPGATKGQWLSAMQGHVLGEAQLVGLYIR